VLESPGLATTAIYLSSCSARQAELRQVAGELEDLGCKVVSSWLWMEGVDLRDHRTAAATAERNLADLQRATMLIAFSGGPDGAESGRGGRHVELGIAIARGLDVVLVGEREHIFHYGTRIKQLADWADIRQILFSAR
jgi:hypothetical protein